MKLWHTIYLLLFFASSFYLFSYYFFIGPLLYLVLFTTSIHIICLILVTRKMGSLTTFLKINLVETLIFPTGLINLDSQPSNILVVGLHHPFLLRALSSFYKIYQDSAMKQQYPHLFSFNTFKGITFLKATRQIADRIFSFPHMLLLLKF